MQADNYAVSTGKAEKFASNQAGLPKAKPDRTDPIGHHIILFCGLY
jgi:hypothetical protein